MLFGKEILSCRYLLVLAGITLVAGDFLYPPPCERVRFEIGDIRNIRFETGWKEYTIALYQQEKDEKSARRGPTLIGKSWDSLMAPVLTRVETKDGAGRRSFAWQVDLNGFRLIDSETFFFWIFEGDASSQGDLSKLSMASPFFNITGAEKARKDRKAEHKEGCARTEADTTPMSSLFLISATSISEEASSEATNPRSGASSHSGSIHQPTKIWTGLSSKASSATSASPLSSRELKAEGLGSPGPTSPKHPQGESPEPHDYGSDQEPSGVSKVSKIGIGIGAGLGGTALIGGLAFLIFKYSKKGEDRARSMVIWCRGLRASQFVRNSSSNTEG